MGRSFRIRASRCEPERKHRDSAPWRQYLREYTPVVFATAVGLLLSLALFMRMHRHQEDIVDYDFSEEAKACVQAFERRLNSNIDEVRWLAATISASPQFSAQEFLDLVEALQEVDNPPMGLNWAPQVEASARLSFERSVGTPDFQIREQAASGGLQEAQDRETYYPLLYIQRPEMRARALGFDLASDPEIARYLKLAADSGNMFFASISPFIKAQSTGGTVFAIYPVYRRHAPLNSDVDRRANLLGFATGLIKLDVLSDKAFDVPIPLEIDVHIFDFFGPTGQKLLYYRPGKSQSRMAPYIDEDNVQRLNEISYVGAIPLGETRRWLLACTPSPDYVIGIESWSPLLGLALGLAFTFVAAYHFHANIRQRRETENLVIRRTAELKQTNERLVHEVAERKHFEQEREGLLELLEASNVSLHTLNSQLERSNRDLQEFALVASHDLKEPLRKVRVLAQSLRDRLGDRLDTGASEYLDLMEGALRRMHALITNLLQISRVSTHGQPFEPVDLNRVVSDVISDLAVRIEETDGAIEVGDFPTIEADPMQMRQFVQNILDNSLKYHREGVPPRISVESVTHITDISDRGSDSRPSGSCTLVFRDNGIGLASESSGRAFTLFQRLENGARVEGSGVGLAVCRKIAERHGGSIAVHSEIGKGSTFTITLPLTHNGR